MLGAVAGFDELSIIFPTLIQAASPDHPGRRLIVVTILCYRQFPRSAHDHFQSFIVATARAGDFTVVAAALLNFPAFRDQCKVVVTG